MDDKAEAIIAAFSAHCSGEKVTAICPICGKTLVVEHEHETTWKVKCPNGCVKEIFHGI